MNICVIPAKGTSTRIPGKNIRNFHGRPILARAIEIAQQSGVFDDIIVSTDSELIADVARVCGVRSFMRGPELSETDGHPDVGTQEVTRDVVEKISNALALMVGNPPAMALDYVCCLYATAALAWPHDLVQGLNRMLTIDKWVYVTDHDGKDCGQWYWGKAQWFMDRVPLTNAEFHRLPPNRAVDINTEEDWLLAEKHFAELKGIT